MPSLPTLHAASPLDSDDGSYFDFSEDASAINQDHGLDNMPSDFGSMDTGLTFRVQARMQNAGGDDTYALQIRIVGPAPDSTVLAAATSGGTREVVSANVRTDAGATDTDLPVAGAGTFTFVNTSANKALWDSALVEIAQVYTQDMAKDANHIQVDLVTFTGTYTATEPVEAALVSGRVVVRAGILAVALGVMAATLVAGTVTVRGGVLGVTQGATSAGIVAGRVEARGGVLTVTSQGFSSQTAALTAGFTSAQSEAGGWNAKVRDALKITWVRTSDTVATGTLQAAADYDITAQETITGTIPGSILTGGSPIVATPTFTIDTADAAVAADLTAGRVVVRGGVLAAQTAPLNSQILAGRVEVCGGVLEATPAPLSAQILAGTVLARGGVLAATTDALNADITSGTVNVRGGILAVTADPLAVDITSGRVLARGGVLGAGAQPVAADIIAGRVEVRGGVLSVSGSEVAAAMVPGKVLVRGGVLVATTDPLNAAVIPGKVEGRGGVLSVTGTPLSAAILAGRVEVRGGVLEALTSPLNAAILAGTVEVRGGVLGVSLSPLAADITAGRVVVRGVILIAGDQPVARHGITASARGRGIIADQRDRGITSASRNRGVIGKEP